MSLRWTSMMLGAATWLAGCECASTDVVDHDSEASSSASSGSSSTTEASGTTAEPFDASRWIGRYHFENVFLPFGERGDPHGSSSLVNFEILPDGRASMFYDNCSFEAPVTIAYEWSPSEEAGWSSLYPGAGESSLRYMANDDVETLRVRLVEPCRELRFEIDGKPDGGFYIIRPGESCWVDRCTAPNIMQVDYCDGEEPPPCG
jgi:hypothetical protein